MASVLKSYSIISARMELVKLQNIEFFCANGIAIRVGNIDREIFKSYCCRRAKIYFVM